MITVRCTDTVLDAVVMNVKHGEEIMPGACEKESGAQECNRARKVCQILTSRKETHT